jgi:hypothetical protein
MTVLSVSRGRVGWISWTANWLLPLWFSPPSMVEHLDRHAILVAAAGAVTLDPTHLARAGGRISAIREVNRPEVKEAR